MEEKKACLRQFIRTACMTNIAFAEKIGMNSSSFQTMMNRPSPLKMDVYDKIVDAMAEIICESERRDFPNTPQLLQLLADFLGCEVGELPARMFTKASNDPFTAAALAMAWGEANQNVRDRMNAAFDQLNEKGQETAADRVQELTQIDSYRKKED